jgi:hypothetical protein
MSEEEVTTMPDTSEVQISLAISDLDVMQPLLAALRDWCAWAERKGEQTALMPAEAALVAAVARLVASSEQRGDSAGEGSPGGARRGTAGCGRFGRVG